MNTDGLFRSGRRYNFLLILGMVLVVGMAILALFGQWLSPHNPLERYYIWQDYKGEWHTPPFDPFEVAAFPLGTDHVGRDVLSRLIWALQPTLALATIVALTRLLAGTVLGFLEGWYSDKWTGDLITGVTQAAASIPLLIVALMVPGLIGYFNDEITHALPAFLIGLSLTGWAPTAQLMAERVRTVRQEQYIEAARALGAGDGRILVNHVLPQVRTLLPILLAFEMSAVLLQMAELGFLGFYYGGTETFMVPDGITPGFRVFPVAGQPELGQMLSAGWDNLFLIPWVGLWSGTMFFLAVLSFTLLGEGLKRYYADGETARVPRWSLARAMGLGGGMERMDSLTSPSLPEAVL